MLLAAIVVVGVLGFASLLGLFRRAAREAGAIAPLAATMRAPVASTVATPCRIVRVYFIKPSKYDDRGRVAYFWRGVLPNNTLTVLAALNAAYNRLRADDDIHVETVLWDEQVDGPIVPATVRAIQEKGVEDGVEVIIGRSEERRVGKECRGRWGPEQ